MITVYLGQSDLYLPVTAALLHLEGKKQNTDIDQLLRPIRKDDDGQLYYVGNDKSGNGVYVVSVKDHPDVFVRGVQSLLGAYQKSVREAVVIPCVPENPQVGLICRLFAALGLSTVADHLGRRLAHNRQSDLRRLVKT